MCDDRPRLVPALLLLLLALPGPAAAAEVNLKGVYDRAVSASGWVRRPKGGAGTGWVIDRGRKLLVTSYHVVREEPSVTVIFPAYKDGKVVAERSQYGTAKGVRGKVLQTDPRRDLALIRLESVPAGVGELKLAARAPDPTDRVHSVGNPGRSEALWVYTAGRVRQVYKKNWRATMSSGKQVLHCSARVIEIQSPVNSGDSGGAVVNDKGEVVGVVHGTSAASQISYAIAATEVQAFVRTALEQADRPAAAR